jgi:murein L,D-transpeptidase YcbB/YkuD
LAEAISLNREAALESASWGRFQIMGANFKQCNYADVETFVNAMCASEANHLHAFSNFCSNGGLISYLKNHDWAHFALHYNGPGQVQYYANMIQNAYNRHLNSNPNSSSNDILKKGMRGYAVILLQTQLKNLGYSLVEDGIFGDDTENAVKALQKKYNIVSDGIVGKQTKSIIEIEIAQKKVPPTIGKAS